MKNIFLKKIVFNHKILFIFFIYILSCLLSYNNLNAQWTPQENLSKNNSLNIISNNSSYIISNNKENYFNIPTNEELPKNQFLFLKGYNEISKSKSENIEFFFLQPSDDVDDNQQNTTFINRLNINPYSICDKDFSVYLNIIDNNSDILKEINVTSSILYFGINDLNYQINIELNENTLIDYFELISDNTDGQVIIKGCSDKTLTFFFSNDKLLSSISFLEDIPNNIFISSILDRDKNSRDYKFDFCQSKSGFIYPFGSGISISDLSTNKCNSELIQIKISDNAYKEILEKQKHEFDFCNYNNRDKCIRSYSSNNDFVYFGETKNGIPDGIGMWYYQGNLRSAGEIVSGKFNGTASSFNVNDKKKFKFGEYSDDFPVNITSTSNFPYIEEWEKILWASKTSNTPISDIFINIEYEWLTEYQSLNYNSQFFNFDIGIIDHKDLNLNSVNFLEINKNLISDNSFNNKPILRFKFNEIAENNSIDCFEEFKFIMKQGDYKYDLTDYAFFIGFDEKNILNINILPTADFFFYFTNKIFSKDDQINIEISLCENLNYPVSSKNLISSLKVLSQKLNGINKFSEIFMPNEEIYEYFIKQNDLSYEMFNIIDGKEKPNFDLTSKMVFINNGLKVINEKNQKLNFDFIGKDKILSLSLVADELQKLNCFGFDNENVFVNFYSKNYKLLTQYNIYTPIKKTASNILVFEDPLNFLQVLYYQFGENNEETKFLEIFTSCKNKSYENLLADNKPIKFLFNVGGWYRQIEKNAKINTSNFFYAIDIRRHNQKSNINPRNDEAIGRALNQLYRDLDIF